MTTTTATRPLADRRATMSDILIVRDYPHPPAKVWRALTEPALMALWGMRPEGFSPTVGTRFKFVAKPQPGWRGFVECEVIEAREPSVLRYSWVGDESGKQTHVTYALEATPGGTRLTFAHTGFTGIGGLLLARVVMTPIRKKMFGVRMPAVLSEIDDDGRQRPETTLKPKS